MSKVHYSPVWKDIQSVLIISLVRVRLFTILNIFGFTRIFFLLEFCLLNLEVFLMVTKNRRFNLTSFLCFLVYCMFWRDLVHIELKSNTFYLAVFEMYSQNSHALVCQKENFQSFKIRQNFIIPSIENF